MAATTPVLPTTMVAGTHSVLVIGTQQVPTTSWTMHRGNPPANLTNARDGRLRIATLADAAGTVDFMYEVGAPPESYMAEGTIIPNAKLYIDYTQSAYYVVNMIVAGLDIHDGGVEAPVSGVMHWELQSGTVQSVNT